MEKKKTCKADLETKRLLFVEIGLVVALAVVYGAFEYSTAEITTAELVDTSAVFDEDFIIPTTFETPLLHLLPYLKSNCQTLSI